MLGSRITMGFVPCLAFCIPIRNIKAHKVTNELFLHFECSAQGAPGMSVCIIQALTCPLLAGLSGIDATDIQCEHKKEQARHIVRYAIRVWHHGPQCCGGIDFGLLMIVKAAAQLLLTALTYAVGMSYCIGYALAQEGSCWDELHLKPLVCKATRVRYVACHSQACFELFFCDCREPGIRHSRCCCSAQAGEAVAVAPCKLEWHTCSGCLCEHMKCCGCDTARAAVNVLACTVPFPVPAVCELHAPKSWQEHSARVLVLS